MSILKKVTLAAAIVVTSTTVNAQNFRIPDKYSFETADGYHKYDKDIIKCVNWMEKTPPGVEDEKVQHAGRFLLEWLSGAPYMRFNSNVRIDAFLGDSPEYRIYYMAGWARAALQAGAAKPDKLSCSYAGIKTVIKVYKEAKHGKKDANIEELIKLDEQNKLKDWVQERV